MDTKFLDKIGEDIIKGWKSFIWTIVLIIGGLALLIGIGIGLLF